MQDALTDVRDESSTEETKVLDIPASDPFKEQSWEETVQQHEQPEPIKPEIEEIKQEEKKEEQTAEQTATEWFKKFGYESEDTASNEIVELKKFKEAAPKEVEFKNEDSKKFFEYLTEGKEDEVYNFLDQKKKLTRLTTSEVNENTAAEMVKLAMQQKYKDFTPEEINYKFNKQFGLPKEPVQTDLEDDTEFEARKTEWQEKVADIKKDLVIEAKIIKPELEKLNTELILPNIQKETNQSAELQSQEELAKIDKLREKYLESLGNDLKNVNGFEATYKNEDVELRVAYSISDEEKTALKSELEDFDVEGFILSTWFKEDGTPNVKSLMEDIYLLRNKEKVFQKIATDTGNKVLENKVKTAKNINVTGNTKVFVPDGDKTEQQKMGEFFFSQ